MKIIDFHAHAKDGSVEHLVNRDAVETSVIHPAFEDFKELEAYHARASRALREYPDRLAVFIGIDFTKEPDHVSEIFDEVGASGIKIHPLLQDFPINNKEFMEPFMGVISRLKTNLYVHTDHPGTPIYNKYRPLLKSKFGRFAKYFPEQEVIIMGHAGNNDSYLLAKEVMKMRKNVVVETSLAPVPSEFEKMIERIEHGEKRIIFGSNEPYSSIDVELKKIDILDITENQKRMILHDNGRRLLG
ncbi:MAG: amidohydrolase family protein [Promethearchaeota archaeon]